MMNVEDAELAHLQKCRTCLQDNCETVTIESLTNSQEMYSLLTYFNIKILDSLPNSICLQCVNHFDSIVKFKRQCMLSEEILQNFFNEQSSKLSKTDDLKLKHTGNWISLDQTYSSSDTIAESDTNKSEGSLVFEKSKISNESDEKYTFICNICNKKFVNKHFFTRHHQKCSGISKKSNINYKFTCKRQRCHFKCETETQLNEHSQNKHDTVCNICNKSFYNHKCLRRHRDIHRSDRLTLYCELCKKFYNSKATFYVHKKKIHSKITRAKIVCTQCGVSVYQIKQHLQHKHSNPTEKFICIYCKKSFKSDLTLRTHTKIHHEDPGKFKSLCPACGRVFRTPYEMKFHVTQVHTNANERKFQCRHCNKTFKTSCHRGKHEKVIHLNDRRFKCDNCFKAFSTKSILDNHSRTHTGEKPFVCNLCSRAFAQKAPLRTHMKLIHGLEIKQFYLKTKPINIKESEDKTDLKIM